MAQPTLSLVGTINSLFLDRYPHTDIRTCAVRAEPSQCVFKGSDDRDLIEAGGPPERVRSVCDQRCTTRCVWLNDVSVVTRLVSTAASAASARPTAGPSLTTACKRAGDGTKRTTMSSNKCITRL
jgi:hypothetical protein